MSEKKLAYVENNDFTKKTDIELVELAKNGDEKALEYIFDKYKDLVNMKVSKYFIIGAEKEDIVQEGMIGLYKAIRNYEENKQNSFKSFANLCIERQLITAIKTSNRQKHLPLNSSVSLSTPVYQSDEDISLMELFNSKVTEDPLDTITKKEYYKFVGNEIDKSLSNFEKKVLTRFAAGDSYVKIAERLDAPVKSVDNAIQRIRKKAGKNIIEE